MKELIIPPVNLTFIATNKCTAACKNCCFSCNPKNKDRLTLSDMKQYVTQSVEEFNTIKILVITGGECFTLGKDLDKIIQFANKKGLKTRVVTNAYWAKSLEKAHLIVNQLVDDGLDEINYSTGDEHQVWVPYENIINAVISSLESRLATVVNIESSNLSDFSSKIFLKDSRLEKYKHLINKKFFLIDGMWMPFLKSTELKLKSLNEENEKKPLIYLQKNEKRCTSLFYAITITPNNQVYSCCGMTLLYNSYLRLGNAQKYSLKTLYEYQFKDFLKIWLFTEGPEKILTFCYQKRKINVNDTSKMHICQICFEIFRDKENISILQKNYSEIYTNVMIKYNLLKEKYNKTFNLQNDEKK